MSRIDRRIPSPKGFATRNNPTFFAPPPFSREVEAYSRRGRARIETAQIDSQMLGGVIEQQTGWNTVDSAVSTRVNTGDESSTSRHGSTH